MSEPFMGEIKIVSFNFPPKGWARCDGQFLPINQNQSLFALFGTMYGGNGQTTFALPNLRGQVPIHMGSGHTQGEVAGSTAVTVNIQQLPAHTHIASGSNTNGSVATPGGNVLGAVNNAYAPTGNGQLTTLNPATISSVGGSQAHNNMMPYLVLNFIVCLIGIFPSQN